jgi:hypothetical protein
MMRAGLGAYFFGAHVESRGGRGSRKTDVQQRPNRPPTGLPVQYISPPPPPGPGPVAMISRIFCRDFNFRVVNIHLIAKLTRHTSTGTQLAILRVTPLPEIKFGLKVFTFTPTSSSSSTVTIRDRASDFHSRRNSGFATSKLSPRPG